MPFYPHKKPKSKFFKNEKISWRYHHLTHAYLISESHDVQFLRYGVRQAEFFCHFGPFFCPFSPLTTWKIKILKLKKTWRYYHFTHLHHKWQSYDVWFLMYGSPPYGPRKWKFWWNEKKTPEDIILQMCTLNVNHMMYRSWDMKCNGQNFLSFWTIFCPFTP